jgi:hypothetical protein
MDALALAEETKNPRVLKAVKKNLPVPPGSGLIGSIGKFFGRKG